MKKTIWFILFLSHLTKAQDYELSNVPKAGSTKTGIEVFMLHYRHQVQTHEFQSEIII